jgi:hypothetical protein
VVAVAVVAREQQAGQEIPHQHHLAKEIMVEPPLRGTHRVWQAVAVAVAEASRGPMELMGGLIPGSAEPAVMVFKIALQEFLLIMQVVVVVAETRLRLFLIMELAGSVAGRTAGIPVQI